MSIRYTKPVSIAGALLTFTLIAGSASAQAPDQPQQPQPQPRPQQAQQQPQQQTARGELVSVDAATKMLTIKPTEGAEQKFQYTDATKVTGAREGVAGLATMSGRQVVVHFMAQGANRVASQIEIQGGEKSEKPEK